MSEGLNRTSSRITQQKSQGGSQAMLYATGLREEDMNKAQVGICANWYEGNPCNMHLNILAGEVKKGVVQAGLVCIRFNAIGGSDGIFIGTHGVRFFLASRDLVSDLVETAIGAERKFVAIWLRWLAY